MEILEILRQDYDRFPKNQTYSLYSETVYFKDPLNEFRGLWRYKLMIRFIETCFLNCKMDLHQIRQEDDRILMDWTLSWNTPLPWKPRIAIPGDSELQVAQGLIISHVDHWHCSRLNVLQQHFRR
jgi:hypothetical protein